MHHRSSTIQAIEAAREFGFDVIGVICLVEREEAGGRPNVEKAAAPAPFVSSSPPDVSQRTSAAKTQPSAEKTASMTIAWIRTTMIQTLEWTDDGVRFIDQTKLPTEEVYVTCTTYEEVADAIRTMVVRGAPAIGVAAAMGVALGVQEFESRNTSPN